MKQRKIEKVNFHHSQGHYELIFDYGDLYMRENVDWDEDVENCRSEIVIKNPEDVLSLNAYIKYTIPDHDDILEMKKNKINKYKIDPEKHLYTVELLNFTQKEGKFRVCEEFWIGYEDTIKKLIKQLKNLKEIYFFGRHFRESEKGLPFDLIDDDDYIRDNCNNPKWPDSMFIEPADDKDYLEQLILLKKQVGTNVKINFESLSEDSVKLIKQFKIVD
jgi:hypothetical protein